MTTTPRRREWRQRVRGAIDRLPVGRDAVMRIAAAVGRRDPNRRAAGRRPGDDRVAAGGGPNVPSTFRVSPPPRRVDGPWPEPPAIDRPMALAADAAKAAGSEGAAGVGAASDAGAGAAGGAQTTGAPRFDIALFEQLNAEYADRPLVPSPRGNDAASAAERARNRLERVHESIDLAGRRVLEFGCAAGYEVWGMAHRFGADAVGIDIAARRAWPELTGPRVRFVEADLATDRPFEAGEFDRIISFSVFEHVAHPNATAAELFHVLRPGGLAWISANLYRGPMASHRYREVNFPWPHILFGDEVFEEFYRRVGRPPVGAAWVNRLSWTEYEALFRRVGFRLRSLRFSERPIDEPFYARFESVLGRYPRWDLARDFFHVVLEKPGRR